MCNGDRAERTPFVEETADERVDEVLSSAAENIPSIPSSGELFAVVAEVAELAGVLSRWES